MTEQLFSDSRAAARLAADYLVRQVKLDGQFVYRITLDPKVGIKPKYNMLRHAGAIYSLGMYHQRFPDERVLDAMTRAVDFLDNEGIAPVPGQEDIMAVWDRQEITLAPAPLQAKLGGAGLALVAMCMFEKFQPGRTPVEDLRELAGFVRFMQRDDGGFFSKYVPEQGGPDPAWISLYYPGEAALGMVMLHEIDPEPAWRDCATRALQFLADSRKSATSVPADHWALIATARLMALPDFPGDGVLRDDLIRHSRQICESMLSEQFQVPEEPDWHGGFAGDTRVTPTATRLEGLLAALRIFSPQDPIRERLLPSIADGIGFLCRAQVPDGPNSGAVPRAIRYATGTTKADKAFNTRAKEVRIDYVQHALSAFLEFGDLEQ